MEPDTMPEGFTRAFHLRNRDDENEIISFGLFDGDIDDLRRVQQEFDYAGQVERMAPFVDSVATDAIFDVVEELQPAR